MPCLAYDLDFINHFSIVVSRKRKNHDKTTSRLPDHFNDRNPDNYRTSFAQVKLFNGKDLSGWKVHGTEKWFVEKGELICESGPDKQYGYLVPDKDFKNFELTVEFKQESNGNSGVFFHCSIEGTKISGWQAEVAPMNKSTGGIYESYGRGWLIKPDAAKEKFLKEGEWNTMVVRMEGNTVKTWLNGEQMIVA